MTGFSTRAIHLKALKKDPFGTLNFPVYDSVAFEFDTAEELALAFEGKKPSHIYSRITNPTVDNFEQKIKSVTGASSVAALSSGMAAIANLIIAIMQNGENIITTKHLFGNTYSLLEKTLKPWGLKTKYADLTDASSIKRLIDEKTRAIIFETITNPQLEVADIAAVSRVAREKKILLIADSTITPLGFANLKKLGVNIEVLSSTKYLSGGATSVGGLIIDYGNYDWASNPKLKDDFKKNSKIKRVDYPGLRSSKYYQIAAMQFGKLTGALLTFDLDSKEKCFAFMNSLEIIRRATNLNDNKTLILHPASTIFCEYGPELKAEMGVRETMIRLAVGIEDADDLIEDINLGLEVI